MERVLANKYYVDELYDATIVRPLVGISRKGLWRGIDAGIIDGLFVNGSAYFARGIGWIGSQLQSGQAGAYAWGIVGHEWLSAYRQTSGRASKRLAAPPRPSAASSSR